MYKIKIKKDDHERIRELLENQGFIYQEKKKSFLVDICAESELNLLLELVAANYIKVKDYEHIEGQLVPEMVVNNTRVEETADIHIADAQEEMIETETVSEDIIEVKNGNIAIFKLEDESSDWGTRSQTIYMDGEEIFSAYDLSECPEDAIIGRDLFDAHDYLSAVKFGMELAARGYTKVELQTVEREEELELD